MLSGAVRTGQLPTAATHFRSAREKVAAERFEPIARLGQPPATRDVTPSLPATSDGIDLRGTSAAACCARRRDARIGRALLSANFGSGHEGSSLPDGAEAARPRPIGIANELHDGGAYAEIVIVIDFHTKHSELIVEGERPRHSEPRGACVAQQELWVGHGARVSAILVHRRAEL